MGPSWHLQHVEVHNTTTGERAMFIADKWLEAKSGTTTITLQNSNLPSADGTVRHRYKVSVQTADKRGAGTDGDVSIILIGDKGRTAEMPIESSADNFERNKLDEFMLDLKELDIGELQQVDIGFSSKQSAAGALGSAFGMSWQLATVEVTHMNDSQKTFFMYDGALDSKKRRVQLSPGAGAADSNVYKVSVRGRAVYCGSVRASSSSGECHRSGTPGIIELKSCRLSVAQ